MSERFVYVLSGLRKVSLRNSRGLSVCVPASLPAVSVVTVPLPNMSVMCEVVPDVECENVQPQTFSLSRKRRASVDFESETEVNSGGPPVEAVLEAIKNRPTPLSAFVVEAVPGSVRSGAPPPSPK